MWDVNLLNDTISLLRHVRDTGDLSIRSIAREPEVPYEWLKRFVRDVEDGKVPDPAVSRVQALHKRLLALKSLHERKPSNSVLHNLTHGE